MDTGAEQLAVRKKQCRDPLAYLRGSTITTYKRAETVCSQDEEAVSIYVVLSGRVKVWRLTEQARFVVGGIFTSDDFFERVPWSNRVERNLLQLWRKLL
jgi:CRP-like cAMP-binding protein